MGQSNVKRLLGLAELSPFTTKMAQADAAYHQWWDEMVAADRCAESGDAVGAYDHLQKARDAYLEHAQLAVDAVRLMGSGAGDGSNEQG